MPKFGRRGGGSANIAQGGLPAGGTDLRQIENILRETAAKFSQAVPR